MPSHLTHQIDTQFRHLQHRHRRGRLSDRWTNEPALTGRAPTEITALCARATTEQNMVVAALLRQHQAGDPDAGMMLLVALGPMLRAVVRLRHRHVTDDLIDNYWTAASHLIGTVDPDTTPTTRDGRPAPFLAYLGDRLTENVRKLDPAERRRYDRRNRGARVVWIDAATESNELADHAQRHPDPSLEDIALARLELADVADVVTSGAIAAERWQQLVEHRLGANTTPSTGAARVAVHRTATRLAELVGHAA